jgi:hypothetical protein
VPVLYSAALVEGLAGAAAGWIELVDSCRRMGSITALLHPDDMVSCPSALSAVVCA